MPIAGRAAEWDCPACSAHDTTSGDPIARRWSFLFDQQARRDRNRHRLTSVLHCRRHRRCNRWTANASRLTPTHPPVECPHEAEAAARGLPRRGADRPRRRASGRVRVLPARQDRLDDARRPRRRPPPLAARLPPRSATAGSRTGTPSRPSTSPSSAARSGTCRTSGSTLTYLGQRAEPYTSRRHPREPLRDHPPRA